MSLELDLSEPHEQMVKRLREAHGEEIELHLRQVVESEIHESYQQLQLEE